MKFPDGTIKEGYFDNNVFKGESKVVAPPVKSVNNAEKYGALGFANAFDKPPFGKQKTDKVRRTREALVANEYGSRRGSRMRLEGITPVRARNCSVPMTSKVRT